MQETIEELAIRTSELKRDERFSQAKTLVLLGFATAIIFFANFKIFTFETNQPEMMLFPFFLNALAWITWLANLMLSWFKRYRYSIEASRDPRDTLRELEYMQHRGRVGAFMVEVLAVFSIVAVVVVVSMLPWT